MWPFTREAYPEVKLEKTENEYDYIICGGGTAGCVLANRLSANPSTRVLVVERGPIADSWTSRVPLFSSDFASDGSRTYIRPSESQGKLASKSFDLYSGRVLGGTSRINQMIYSRGLPAEYDAWRDAGRVGWGWEDMKPYFLKSERANYKGDASVHAQTGEWHNSTSEDFEFRGFNKTITACENLGLPYIDDINSPSHPPFGCGRLHFTRDSNAYRNSTFHAFLPKKLVIQRKKNLHICTGSIVEKLEIDARRNVRGVHLASGRVTKLVRAAGEVVLSAGPFASPQILMLSGIGPAHHLKELDIPIIKNLPAVGSNLEDHLGVSIAFRAPMKDSLLSLERSIWVFFVEFFRYILFGTGMLLAPVLQLAIFTSSQFLDTRGVPTKTKLASSKSVPDIEIMPMAYDSGDSKKWDKSKGVYSFLNVLLHPKSKGSVKLTSRDPTASLNIDLNYLSDQSDFGPLRAALRLTLRIRDNMRALGYPLVDWEVPAGEDDGALDDFIRRPTRNRSTYHYSSTCRMAPEDDKDGGGVVDDELKVHGLKGLRVADSSVFPWVLGAHLQAPTVAVAEKCADMMLQEARKLA
ncbi:alcohol oxidase [Collybia nuda]|uniref:Alcohol oxidase n=1 Tax=Collybia nuda TaxID=64659 RepID=A0A9P5YDZ0_9AGAR|nr:alcohol oxidase [Collybia nuda]